MYSSMITLSYALIAAGIVSAMSLVGVVLLSLRDALVHRMFVYLIGLSAGALMGGALFHLLPEATEELGDPLHTFALAAIGFCSFFILEKFLRWHHHHDPLCDDHAHHPSRHLAFMNLAGDAVHNFIDGLVILAAFAVDTTLGVAVTISVALHELPHEIGDFGVLLYAGLSKARALAYNFLTALTAVIGVIAGHFLFSASDTMAIVLMPLAAGGFIYIAAADLIPELHKDTKTHSSLWSFIVFVLMLVFMYAVKVLFE